MDLYGALIRPLLFRLPAEVAHNLAHQTLRHPTIWRVLGTSVESRRLGTSLAGLPVENPIGLAPGFDKNGTSIEGLQWLGFGYLVIGSVTRHPREGNPKPRMVRYPDRKALGNNLGLPSAGLEEVLATLRSLRPARVPVLVSVTGFSADELVEAALAMESLADAVELGLVCPNTTESQRMAELSIFEEVAQRVMARRTKPVFVRLPPHHDEDEWKRAKGILDVCMERGIDGVGTNGRTRVTDPRLPNGEGSISGEPTFPDALRIVRDVAGYTGGSLAIRASGGVSTGEDAARMLAAGATTIEIYSSLVFRGPSAPALINRELLKFMDNSGMSDVEALRRGPVAADGPPESSR